MKDHVALWCAVGVLAVQLAEVKHSWGLLAFGVAVIGCQCVALAAAFWREVVRPHRRDS